MKLTRYIRPGCFIPDLKESSREGALRSIIHAAAETGLLADETNVLAMCIARENVQSTAVANGVAIPHCFTDEVPDLLVVVACSLEGLDFQSFDGKPTRVVFLLIGNRQEHALHLKALAQIARLIRSTSFIERIALCDSRQDLVRVVDEEQAKVS